MSRINVCQACDNIKYGLNTRIYILHTCGKSLNDIYMYIEKCNDELRERMKRVNSPQEIQKEFDRLNMQQSEEEQKNG